MTGLIFLDVVVVILALLAGLLVKWLLDQRGSHLEITWKEFWLGSLAVVPIMAVIVSLVGWKMAYQSQVTFQEYWNGWEKEATWIKTDCYRDGPCIREYDCDSYRCNPHDCNCRCTSKDRDGNCISQSCDTCYDTCYHDCPYATQEWTFVVKTTIGDYTVAQGTFPDQPQGWRGPIPAWVIERYGKGVPPFWQAAKNRLDTGAPGPVTRRMPYENLILASDLTILKQYSDQVDQLKEWGLLPDLRCDVRDWYLADKVYFVGYQPENAKQWQEAHAYLNAALGTELQGDLHLVIIQDSRADLNPDAYIMALKAYWQSPEYWAKNAISKNSVVVVLGTDGQTVKWARAQTGMPLGNEALLIGIRTHFRENQIPLTPEAVIGSLKGEFYQKVDEETGETKIKVRGVGETGALRRLLWGLDEPSAKFTRVSMSGDDADDNGLGFKYLAGEIEPTSGQKWLIGVVSFVLCCGVWLAFAYIGERGGYGRRRSSYRYY